MQNQTLRQKIEQLFGLPAMKMPWGLYLGQLNEAGKLTARSMMEILTVLLTVVEGMEREEVYQTPSVEKKIETVVKMMEKPVKTSELPQELKM
jgi:hypothetical protein